VQQLAIHTIGGVVTPAQALLVLVPQESQLAIEAMISNRDIGFVHPGQDAEIKIDTFTFTRYGLLHGRAQRPRDAITQDTPQDKVNERSARHRRREQRAQGPGYPMRRGSSSTARRCNRQTRSISVSAWRSQWNQDWRAQRAQYLLSPILRYKHESLRERK
jgi:hemolysin D